MSRFTEFIILPAIGFAKGLLVFSFMLASLFSISKFSPESSVTSHLLEIAPVGEMALPMSAETRDRHPIEENGTVRTEDIEMFNFILRFSRDVSPKNALRIAKVIREDCELYGIDPFLVLSVIQVESNFSPTAVSHRGAVGLMQLMPSTGRFAAKQLGISLSGSKSLYNPLINVRLGIFYLSYLSDQFQDTEDVLVAYNYGPGRLKSVKRYGTRPSYVRKVMSFKSFLEEERLKS